MDRRLLIAAVTNIGATVATYACYGVNVAAGAAAARNTARVSAIFFAVAIATRFHARFRHDYAAWMQAFITAHVIHFGTVIVYHGLLGKLATAQFWAIASTGATLLAATAFTLRRAPKIHLALTYVIWIAFMVALSSRLSKHLLPETPILVLLAVATIIHVATALRKQNAQVASA